MKVEDRWLFQTKSNYLSEDDGLISPYVPPEQFKRFERFQGVKVFRNDKTFLVKEEKFHDRIRSRAPLTKENLYNRFILKYETGFNWSCVSFNKQERFWQYLKNDYKNDVLDCY
jgi:hypothetical protein